LPAADATRAVATIGATAARTARIHLSGWEIEIVEEVQEFLTGSRGRRPVDRVLATVLFTDIVGSTERASQLGDGARRGLLDRQTTSSDASSSVTTGDGFLATFDGPARAIACALAIRDAVRKLGIDIRAGIHSGEIEIDGDDIAGIAVHIGARVASEAGAGQTFVSRTVVDLVAGSRLTFEDAGEPY